MDIVTFVDDLAARWSQPLIVVAALVVAAWVVTRVRRARRRTRGAYVVHISAPPEVPPDAARALWIHLAGIAAPGWRRHLGLGQTRVAFEYVFRGRDMDIRLWVPGDIPEGVVTAAVASAWPGASTTIEHAPAGTPPW